MLNTQQTMPASVGTVPHETLATQRSSLASTADRPLRLLFVTPRYFPFIGGVEHHVHQVAGRLARAGVDVTILTTDPQGQLAAEEIIDGVRVCRVRAWPSQRDYYFAPGIYRFITNGAWDLVHLQSYHTLVAPLAMFAAWKAHIPYVVTFHGGGHSSPLRNAVRGIQRTLLRPLLARAQRLVAIARFEIVQYGNQLHLSDQHFVQIPNGCDLPMPVHTTPNPGETMIVSLGRLEQYKGHHRVIAALPHILRQRPDVHLWIAGSGPYEAELRQLADTLGVGDNVHIYAIPASERGKMAEELAKAALVMLLSEYETQPLAVLEAVSLGRPALVADTSGLSELAEQGLAHAIPLHSTPEQVASAVLDQLEHPRVPPQVQLPTWDNCATALLTLYKAVLHKQQCIS